MSKIILITVCSTGVGLASSKLFFEKGWNAVETMRNPDKDTELWKFNTLRMVVLKLDATDLASIEQAIAASIVKFLKTMS